MIYNVYKNCSDHHFEFLKQKLEILKEKILEIFGKTLEQKIRHDDSDYLILNFSVINKNFFGSNLAIVFQDEINSSDFEMVIIKTLDRGMYRYYKEEVIIEKININSLEKDFKQYIDKALEKYESWDESTLLKSKKTEIG
jgi:hypothetical protein